MAQDVFKGKQHIDVELGEPIFCVAASTADPIFVVGSANGRVSGYSWSDEVVKKPIWSTKRHKGSTRAVGLSVDNSLVYTAGSDGVIKCAYTDSGRAISKDTKTANGPYTNLVTTERFVLTGTEDDESQLIVYSTKDLQKTHKFNQIHNDYITSITPLPHLNDYHFVTSGATTLAHIDIRKGVISTSEDEETELLCGCLVDYPYTSKVPDQDAQKVSNSVTGVFGTETGVITIWKGGWDDQQARIVLNKQGETVDCLIPSPTAIGKNKEKFKNYYYDQNTVFNRTSVISGCGDGTISLVDVHSSKILNQFNHPDPEGIAGLTFDYAGRLLCGGGSIISMWDSTRIVDSHTNNNQENSDSDIESKEKTKRKRKRRTSKNISKRNEPAFEGLD